MRVILNVEPSELMRLMFRAEVNTRKWIVLSTWVASGNWLRM